MFRPAFFVAAAALLAGVSSATAAESSCQITFRIGTSTELFSATGIASYVNAPGEFKGESTFVECEALNNSIVSFGDADEARGLVMAAVGSPTAIKGPKDILRCTWLPTSRFPTISDFQFQDESAFTPAFQPADPDFKVSDIDCEGFNPTTTTTLPEDECGDFDDNGTIQVTDALGVLKAAVGAVPCLACVCDVDGSGTKSTADALITLRIAVGINLSTNCSPC